MLLLPSCCRKRTGIASCPLTSGSSDGGRLNLEHERGKNQPGDTEQGHGRRGVEWPEAHTEQIKVLEGFVHIRGVDAEPCDVCW